MDNSNDFIVWYDVWAKKISKNQKKIRAIKAQIDNLESKLNERPYGSVPPRMGSALFEFIEIKFQALHEEVDSLTNQLHEQKIRKSS
jgi:dynactin complex subunit